jgi:methylated-DNA-[protein]-cysteine S-methyltransferase
MTMSMLWQTSVASPVGPLRLVASDTALVAVHFPIEKHPRRLEADNTAQHPLLERARRELDEYFLGRRRSFEVPLALEGTPFQLEVWNALRRIPFAEVRSYGALARAIGRAAAVRAVGRANGSNPIPIFVPCHRVIGTDGSLTGFGGGIECKRWLLDHERRTAGLLAEQYALPLDAGARKSPRGAPIRRIPADPA